MGGELVLGCDGSLGRTGMVLGRNTAVTFTNIVCVRRHVVELFVESWETGFVYAVKGINESFNGYSEDGQAQKV